MPDLIMLMVTYHRPNDLAKSLQSVLQHTPELHHLHLLDNSMGAIDHQLNSITDDRVVVHRSRTNVGKGAIVCQHYQEALRDCPLNHFVGIDSDIVVLPGWYPTLLAAAREVPPWAAMAPVIGKPGLHSPNTVAPHEHLPNTEEVRPGIWYNQRTAGGLLLIRRPFWENWGGYPGQQLYGNDDGALCTAAVNRRQFIGYTNRVSVEHWELDVDDGYRIWKQDNVHGDQTGYGYWDHSDRNCHPG